MKEPLPMDELDSTIGDPVTFWGDFIGKKYKKDIGIINRVWPDIRSFKIDYSDIVAAGKDGIHYAETLLQSPANTLKDIRYAIEFHKIFKKKGKLLPVDIRIVHIEKKIPIRDLRGNIHAGMFISVEGTIKRVSSRRERLVSGVFRCPNWHRTVKKQPYAIKEFPTECSAEGCRAKPNELLPDFSEFIDTQTAVIQEYIENLALGEQPQTIELSLNERLIDTVSAGNRVVINGILKRYQTSSGKMSTIYRNYIEVNSVEVVEKEYAELEISDEDIAQIQVLAKDPDIYIRLARSLVPSVYGFDQIKIAAAYQFFGGSMTVSSQGVETRGDVHILMIGEPGIAKTEFLRKIVRYSPRGIFTSGKGSSGVGLAASVVKGDAGEDSYVVEPGAFALADGGICVVDEINHIDEKEYSMLYEAMEIQQVSINKATIHQTIYTRCSVFAAANPVDGWLDDMIPLRNQIKMPGAFLSRFDLIFILRDMADPVHDERVIRHIIGVRSGELNSDRFAPDIEPELFRKYVAFAKRLGVLKWSKQAEDVVAKYYLSIRGTRASIDTKPVPITPRQGNSLARLSEASARIRLSLKVEVQDVERGIAILDDCLRKVAYDHQTGIFDAGVYSAGKTKKQTGLEHAIRDAIRRLADENGRAKVLDVVSSLALTIEQKDAVEKMLVQMEREGMILKPRNGLVKLI
jgi:replicative DNA helicase Mcm